MKSDDTPKLYAIRIAATIYMLGTPNDATAAIDEYLRDACADDVLDIVREVKPGHAIEGDWDDDSLVYGPLDTTLRECLDAIPGYREAEAKWLAQMRETRAKIQQMRETRAKIQQMRETRAKIQQIQSKEQA